jgi:predicted MPP superfamily phosphohydrolase
MRAAWLTDIHLNFLRTDDMHGFLEVLWAMEVDAFLIGGDIAEAVDLLYYLKKIDAALDRPVYFVLGNHDYYHGSIRGVRTEVAKFCAEHPKFHYLTQSEACELSPRVALVGHDGWSDARLGDYEKSIVMMADYEWIEELVPGGRQGRWEILKRLGDEAAAHIREVLPPALEKYPEAVLLTHIPPTRDSCWYAGKHSDDNWAPHFTCKAMGDAILEIMREYPQRKLTVLCGHTHGRGTSHPLPNVTIFTGGALYGQPAVERVFTF